MFIYLCVSMHECVCMYNFKNRAREKNRKRTTDLLQNLILENIQNPMQSQLAQLSNKLAQEKLC